MYKKSKNKTRIILSIIFAFLLVWGVISMISLYLSKLNLHRGFLEVSGRIEGYEYHAGTKVSGKVAEMFIEEGSKVKKGDPIGKIYSKQIETALEEAKARLVLAEKEYGHYKTLASRDAVAKIRGDQAEENYRVAQEGFNRANADLDDTLILSPVDGVVVAQIVRPGEVVGQGTPLVTIINMDDLFLKIFLSTEFAGKVNLGDEARIFPDSMPKDGFNAYVNKVAEKAEFTPKNVETKSQRAKLVFELKLKVKENTDYKLKPGMPADGVIKIKKDVSWNKYKR